MEIPRQIKRFEEVIGVKSIWTAPTMKKPGLEDFERGYIAIREDLVKQILDDILQKGQFCIITGPHDSGKTWLCCALGFELEKRRGQSLRFIEVDGDLKTDSIWNCIKKGGKLNWISYWIVEDCQNNRLQVDDLIQKISQSKLEKIKFIFVLRKTVKLTPEDGVFYKLSRKERCEVRLGERDDRTIAHVENIIRTFIKMKDIRKFVEVNDDEIKSVVEKWGYNLNLHDVSLLLTEGWHFDRGMKLSEVKEDIVYDSWWSPYGKIKLELPERRNVLLAVSALCQFEPLIVSSVFLHSVDSKMVMELEMEGIIERRKWRGKDFFMISEGDAEWVLRVVSNKISSQFVESEVKRIFKEYIKSNPPNWMYVFYDLYLARDDRPGSRKILTYLLFDKETWGVVKDLGKESSLLDALPFLESILWVDFQQDYIQDFWSYYIKSKGMDAVKKEISDLKVSTKNLHRLYELTPINGLKREIISNLNKRFRYSTAKKINDELASLHKYWKIDFRSFFDSFSVLDFINIVNNSSLRSIRTLFGNFIVHRKLTNAPFMLRFAEALSDERVDRERLIKQESASLYRLNGLIQFVEKVSPQSAKKLIKKLSQLDLNDLFSRDVDLEAKEGGKTKAEIVKGLHTQICKLRLYHCWEEIISKINDKTWNNILHSSDPVQNFWLLWNIYRHNQLEAKQLAKINEHFLKQIIPQIEFSLPALGILHLCEINIQKIKIGKIDIGKVKRTLDELKDKERPPCTQIILSLIALKAKLPPKQFQIFKEILHEPLIRKCIYNNIDPQLGQVLQKLVEGL